MKDKFKQIISAIPDGEIELSPSEFAEAYRTLSSDVSTIQGSFKYSLTPYLREIVDTLSPYHPAKVTAVMKSAQIGFTEGVVVNGMLWIIKNNPGNVMTLSANDQLSRELIETRLDQGIASCGLQQLIRPNTIRKRNSRTGDTSNHKEFAGGRIFAGGLQSVDKIGKQRSIKYGFFDDWDAAPLADKKQGNIFDLLQQRFATAANSMKQYFISTPETRPSNIELVYLKGDQRIWMLPCPKCGAFIEILWKQIKYKKTDTGKLEEGTVEYECQECSQHFTEKHKYEMNLNGVWVPTAEPEQPGYYSYHITALTAAPHMYGWVHYVRQWLQIYQDGQEKKSKLKVFNNLVLGQPWQEKQSEVSRNVLSKNTRSYRIGVIPTLKSRTDGNGDIILLTCACDLNGTKDDARMDYEVVGWSESGSSYSIDAGSIGTYQPGKPKENRELWSYDMTNPLNVWSYFLTEIIQKEYYTDEGNEMKIFMTGIDTGYLDSYCWQFINQNKDICTGLKGEVTERFHKAGADIPIFKPAKERPNLYILQVDLIKDQLAERIGLKWNRGNIQPSGFMNFPEPSDGKYTVRSYFAQYEAEKKILQENEDGDVVGYKWTRKNNMAANHFFDVAVYNLALRDIVVYRVMKELKMKSNSWVDFVEVIKNL